MSVDFDEALRIGLSTYNDYGYCKDWGQKFKTIVSKLQKHLKGKNLEYSHEAAKAWIGENAEHWSAGKILTIGRFLRVFDDIVLHGRSTILVPKEDRYKYDELSIWSKESINAYVESLTYAETYKRQIRQHCGRFFKLLDKNGITSFADFPLKIAYNFLQTDEHSSAMSTADFRKDILRCIRYLIKEEGLDEYIWWQIKEILDPDHSNIVLSEDERQRLLNITDAISKKPISEFDIASNRLLTYLKENKHSEGGQRGAGQALSEFRAFMALNRLPYSFVLSKVWLNLNRNPAWGDSKSQIFRRTLYCLNEIMVSGSVQTKQFNGKYDEPCTLPEWSANDYNKYFTRKTKEGYAPDYIRNLMAVCKRFIKFLECRKVSSWKEITPIIIKDFHADLKDVLPITRNSIMRGLRRFIEFLCDEGLMQETLILAIPHDRALKVRIVRVLDSQEIQRIYDYRANAKTPMELRHIAITMLGLKLGIRGVDIVRLKLTDINWSKRTISFVQHKTNKRVDDLPMPIEVRNSLWKYIYHGRPKQASCDNIFVKHQAPYGFMHRNSACAYAAKTVYKDSPSLGSRFHVTRKTFATGMLRAGNDPHAISDFMGGVPESLKPYLGGDEEHMRLCPLGIDGIEYTGDLRL